MISRLEGKYGSKEGWKNPDTAEFPKLERELTVSKDVGPSQLRSDPLDPSLGEPIISNKSSG